MFAPYPEKCNLVATTGQSDTSSGTHKEICQVHVSQCQVDVLKGLRSLPDLAYLPEQPNSIKPQPSD